LTGAGLKEIMLDPFSISWLGSAGKASTVVLSQNFKVLWIPGIDSKEKIPPAYVAWRAGATTLILVPTRFLAPIDCSKIPAQKKFNFFSRNALGESLNFMRL
jgi:hypothetical protein